ncbi:hypothetical protein EC973_007272 [Apophysomyces ossiformis]|uniref:Amine oxidase domain-containing protein n=1 Tax=Apophysomyces ossiformis TaxID=679940 RepID=A0A8H7BMJ9_9FUNG|nr:hypothetical protein EC973_007272 [Apophysomyces ossiformis]
MLNLRESFQIYGKGDNPIYWLSTQHGLKTVKNDKSNLVFFDTKGPISSHVARPIYESFENIMEDLVHYADQRMKQNRVDVSGRVALSLLGWCPDTPLKAAIEYFAVDWELAEPADISSLDYATGTVDMVDGSYPAGNEFVIDERLNRPLPCFDSMTDVHLGRGFNFILRQEAATFLLDDDPRLMLGSRILDVFYNDHNVIVVTDNGHTIVADYAICTFSLGVLQGNDVHFHPPFPEWKREALFSFHMTTYTKIFLKFDRKFWEDWQFAVYASPKSETGSRYIVWQNLNAPGYLGELEHMLMVTTTYKDSERIEHMTDSDIQREIVQVLRNMFGQDIPEPSAILVPRWHSNPLFRGSYSNWPIGAFEKHHQNLRAPLGEVPRLWFAGEATSEQQYGFLHGAWLEGISVAEKVAGCIIHKCSVPSFDEYVTGCEDNFRFRRQKPLNFYNQAQKRSDFLS